jgi:hypothetical protein
MLDDQGLSVAGVHYFTFNQLVNTWHWQHGKQQASVRRSKVRVVPSGYVDPEQTTA